MASFKRTSIGLVSLVMLLSLVLSACGGKDTAPTNTSTSSAPPATSASETPQPAQEPPKEPVEITIAFPWDEATFHNRFDVVDEKLPNITIKFLSYDNSAANLQEKFAAGITPDIVISWNYATYTDLNIIEPLDDLIAKNQFDLNTIAPSLVANIRSRENDGSFIGMPDGTGYHGLYYNKEIFDKFGVPYPDPNKPMTWDEVLDLAKKMTAERDGIKYRGLEMSTQAYDELALFVSDAATGEVSMDKDPKIQKYFELMKKYYSIPGILDQNKSMQWIFQQGLTAMTIAGNNFLGQDWGDSNGIKDKIDLVPIPVWPDQPNAPVLNTTPMVINKYSKHKQEAFEVLREYVSKDNQLKISRTMASGPVVTDQEVLAQFGAELPDYKGKNVKAMFVSQPSEFTARYSKWDLWVDIWAAIDQFGKSDMDVVTFLRKYSDAARGKVKDAMAQDAAK